MLSFPPICRVCEETTLNSKPETLNPNVQTLHRDISLSLSLPLSPSLSLPGGGGGGGGGEDTEKIPEIDVEV